MEKGCYNCKYELCKEDKYPCVQCKNTVLFGTEERENRPFLWESQEENDVVNHPSHYCQEGSMECIDEMVAVFGTEAVMNFYLCNVWKYRKRAMFKNGEEDMKKSDWYMNKYVELGGKV